MTANINLNSYFRRIGYTGDASATLKTLKKLHQLHPRAIAFENLNPLLGLEVHLEPDALQEKLIAGRRGGYCFEQNLLFMHVLKALGYKVRGLGARIMWNKPDHEITSRGHMLLLIDLDGEQWIADVGFGGLGPTAPLQLTIFTEQQTPHESYKLIAAGDDYILQSNIKGEWRSLYRFGMEHQYLSDYQLVNWYLSNHPSSHFITGLVAARPEPGRRHALSNNEYTMHFTNGESEKRILRTVSEITHILEDQFLLKLPETPDLEAKLSQLIPSSEPVK